MGDVVRLWRKPEKIPRCFKKYWVSIEEGIFVRGKDPRRCGLVMFVDVQEHEFTVRVKVLGETLERTFKRGWNVNLKLSKQLDVTIGVCAVEESRMLLYFDATPGKRVWIKAKDFELCFGSVGPRNPTAV